MPARSGWRWYGCSRLSMQLCKSLSDSQEPAQDEFGGGRRKQSDG